MTISIEQLTVGQMQANCYLLTDQTTKAGIIIDPGDDAELIIDHITSRQMVPSLIVATHGHFDHIMAACALQLAYQIPFVIAEADTFLVSRMHETAQHFLGRIPVDPPPVITKRISHADTIGIDGINFDVLAAPGHTPGGVVLYSSIDSCCFVGDTVFAGGSVGRTDFSYSDKQLLYDSIRKILKLPAETLVYCGHGEMTSVAALRVQFAGIFA